MGVVVKCHVVQKSVFHEYLQTMGAWILSKMVGRTSKLAWEVPAGHRSTNALKFNVDGPVRSNVLTKVRLRDEDEVQEASPRNFWGKFPLKLNRDRVQ